jgi:hypothetical protein
MGKEKKSAAGWKVVPFLLLAVTACLAILHKYPTAGESLPESGMGWFISIVFQGYWGLAALWAGLSFILWQIAKGKAADAEEGSLVNQRWSFLVVYAIAAVIGFGLQNPAKSNLPIVTRTIERIQNGVENVGETRIETPKKAVETAERITNTEIGDHLPKGKKIGLVFPYFLILLLVVYVTRMLGKAWLGWVAILIFALWALNQELLAKQLGLGGAALLMVVQLLLPFSKKADKGYLTKVDTYVVLGLMALAGLVYAWFALGAASWPWETIGGIAFAVAALFVGIWIYRSIKADNSAKTVLLVVAASGLLLTGCQDPKGPATIGGESGVTDSTTIYDIEEETPKSYDDTPPPAAANAYTPDGNGGGNRKSTAGDRGWQPDSDQSSSGEVWVIQFVAVSTDAAAQDYLRQKGLLSVGLVRPVGSLHGACWRETFGSAKAAKAGYLAFRKENKEFANATPPPKKVAAVKITGLKPVFSAPTLR